MGLSDIASAFKEFSKIYDMGASEEEIKKCVYRSIEKDCLQEYTNIIDGFEWGFVDTFMGMRDVIFYGLNKKKYKSIVKTVGLILRERQMLDKSFLDCLLKKTNGFVKLDHICPEKIYEVVLIFYDEKKIFIKHLDYSDRFVSVVCNTEEFEKYLLELVSQLLEYSLLSLNNDNFCSKYSGVYLKNGKKKRDFNDCCLDKSIYMFEKQIFK